MSDEVILMLGGSSDLAADALARLMANRPDARVVLQYRSGKDRIDAHTARYGARVVPVELDLEGTGVFAFAASFVERFGVPRSVLHFAAGALRLERFSKWNAVHFMQDMQIQVGAMAQILSELLPSMSKAAQRSQVVFVLSSVTRGVPPKFMSMYTTVKYAQLGLMRSLAAEYVGTSVSINAVSPAMVNTRYLGTIPERAVEMATAGAPHKKLLEAADVGAVIEFLLSPAAEHLMGVEIPIADGAVA